MSNALLAKHILRISALKLITIASERLAHLTEIK